MDPPEVRVRRCYARGRVPVRHRWSPTITSVILRSRLAVHALLQVGGRIPDVETSRSLVLVFTCPAADVAEGMRQMTARPLRTLGDPRDHERPARYRPWFQRQPRVTAMVSAGMFVTVTAIRLAMGDDAAVAVSMLYTLPVSLVAMTWGRLAGVGAAVLAVALMGVWVLVANVDLSWVGWLSRAVPLVLIGFLLGDAGQRLGRAEHERAWAEEREQRHRQGVEINDSLIQGMAAAKWSLESGNLSAGLTILDDTIRRGQSLVSELIRDAEAVDGSPGL